MYENLKQRPRRVSGSYLTEAVTMRWAQVRALPVAHALYVGQIEMRSKSGVMTAVLLLYHNHIKVYI